MEGALGDAGPRRGRALELGCGTGFVTRGLFDSGAVGLAACSDVSPEASAESRERFRGTPLEPVVCDAAEAFRPGAFDAIYFNPPYLQCEPEEDPTVCGGEGAEVPLWFLESARRALAGGGRIYALVGRDSEGRLLEAARRLGLVGGERCRLGLFFEELVVLELLAP